MKLRILNVCHDIKKLEENEDAFQSQVIDTIQASGRRALGDSRSTCFWFLARTSVSSNLSSSDPPRPPFHGKYAAHADDLGAVLPIHTGPRHYLQRHSDDLGMRFVGGVLAAEMFDLLQVEEQKRLMFFWEGFLRAIRRTPPHAKGALPRQHNEVQRTRPGDVRQQDFHGWLEDPRPHRCRQGRHQPSEHGLSILRLRLRSRWKSSASTT